MMTSIRFTIGRTARLRRCVPVSSFVAVFCLLSLACGADLGSRPARGLDGIWAFATDPDRVGEKEQWFQPQAAWPAMPRPGYAAGANGTIRVPGIWDNQGYGTETPKVRHNFVGLGWYRRTLAVPAEWADRRVYLCIGGVHRYAKVWVNGQFLGEHLGYLSEFEFDLTDRVKPGQPAAVVIQVDSRQRWDVDTMFGASDLADYMDVVWGGIWGHVRLEARTAVWLSDLFLQPNVSGSNCTASAVIQGEARLAQAVKLEVRDSRGRAVGETERRFDGPLAAGATISVTTPVPNAQLWSPDQPALYQARLTLLRVGQPLDTVESRFGMRDLRFDGPYVLLNGRRLFLRRRALGRFLLGQFLGVPPQSLQFGQSEREEPILISPGADACRFNSSHAESVFAMAISTGAAAVGVDVETMRLDWDWEGVTEMYLDPGRLAQLRAVSQSERQETFLRFWSLREAFAKATGEGIVYESEDGVKSEQVWDLLFHPARLADEVAAAGWRWQTRRLHIGDKDAVVAAVRRGA